MDNQYNKSRRRRGQEDQQTQESFQTAEIANELNLQRQMEAETAADPATPSSALFNNTDGINTQGVTAAGSTQSVITKEVLREAIATLQKYKQGKANLEKRIVENEQWFKLRHWETVGAVERPGELMSKSGWLFNSLLNRHADAMDSYPKPNVLPREEGDRAEASVLTSIIPVILDRCNFEQVYSDVWWYKLKSGTGCYGVFWDPSLGDGLGDISIKKIDLLNVFWQPGITDIQDSRNLFIVALVDRDLLKQQYPQISDRVVSSDSLNVSKYVYDDSIDTSEKTCVIDWYYKVSDGKGGHLLQYVKFVDDVVLYASEDQPEYKATGFYEHGQYPVVLDSLFPVEGSPAGFGYLDLMKNPQLLIDTLTGAIVKNSVLRAKPRFAMRKDMGLNLQEFLDGESDILEVSGSMDETNYRQISVDGIDGNVLNTLQLIIDQLKETSGNRDFSQGTTTSGVTAASAIAALQEAGSKTARDMNKSAYRAFRSIVYLCIDLIRQFYDAPRKFRVIGEDGLERFIQYTNKRIQSHLYTSIVGEYEARPVFDIKVTAEKASPFSTVSQNELAKELYAAGFFNPQLADQALAALEMMDFESKTMVQRRIQQNGTMYQQILSMQQTLSKLAAIVDAQNGTTISAGMQMDGTLGQSGSTAQPSSGGSDKADLAVDAYGAARSGSSTSTAGQARQRAAELATPR